MASTIIHIGDLDKIAEDAPPALQFLKSYVPALDTLDGDSHSHRSVHFSPTATLQINADPAIPFTSMTPLFEMRAKMTLQFEHVVNRLWVVTPEYENAAVTVLMDWTSTTVFKGLEDKPVVVNEFSVLKLEKAGKSKGVCGLWVESAANWMDVGAVKEIGSQLRNTGSHE
ncbi:hypothetical protein N0V90_007463 [Kalmusia sp. IMI 367209]|nr:hypothetical protein N0V90_007463 [Kalmusia sp. IMI 367209]